MQTILDFGPQPAANLLQAIPNATVKKVRLALDYCENCGHGQQREFYPPVELFSNYLYRSGTTTTLRNYFSWLAAGIASSAEVDTTIVELASNDGTFLGALQKAGIPALGVEPAGNLVDICRNNGLHVIHGFWPNIQLPQKVDRIVAMNVLAHGIDPLSFLIGVRENLNPDGVAIIQVSQIDMFPNKEFDTLYHEHYSFFCPNSLNQIALRAGFSKASYCKVAVHGGSLIGVLGFDYSPVDSVIAALLGDPFGQGVLSPSERPSSQHANSFRRRTRETCQSVLMLGQLANESGRKFVLVGAAAKAVTMLQASDAHFDLVVDEAEQKIGSFIPGTNLQVRSFDELKAIEQSCFFVVGAWNFRSEIEEKLRVCRLKSWRDITSVYFPNLSIGPLFC